MKPRTPPLQSPRLLDQLRERIRYLHYSLSTEKLYVHWVRFFIRWHGLKHPREMGATEIEAFLSMLAKERRVSASTHNQALNALLLLYREVLGVDLPWLNGIQRPSVPKRIPSVLTTAEGSGLLAAQSASSLRPNSQQTNDRKQEPSRGHRHRHRVPPPGQLARPPSGQAACHQGRWHRVEEEGHQVPAVAPVLTFGLNEEQGDVQARGDQQRAQQPEVTAQALGGPLGWGMGLVFVGHDSRLTE